jgi:DNA repair exonuclease SbcCD ATPase subunit
LLKDLEEEKSKVADLQHKLDSCKEDTEDAQVGDLFWYVGLIVVRVVSFAALQACKDRVEELKSQVQELTAKLNETSENTTKPSMGQEQVQEEVDIPKELVKDLPKSTSPLPSEETEV